MGAHGECTREVMGAAPGTRLSWLGGREVELAGECTEEGRGSWYTSLGGSSRGGAPGTRLQVGVHVGSPGSHLVGRRDDTWRHYAFRGNLTPLAWFQTYFN